MKTFVQRIAWAASMRYIPVAKFEDELDECHPITDMMDEGRHVTGALVFDDGGWIMVMDDKVWCPCDRDDLSSTDVGKVIDFLWENHSQYQ